MIGSICVKHKTIVVVSKITAQLLLHVYGNWFYYICPHSVFNIPKWVVQWQKFAAQFFI